MKRLEDYKVSKFTPQEPVADPQVSPDGETIAFTYSEVNYDARESVEEATQGI